MSSSSTNNSTLSPQQQVTPYDAKVGGALIKSPGLSPHKPENTNNSDAKSRQAAAALQPSAYALLKPSVDGSGAPPPQQRSVSSSLRRRVVAEEDTIEEVVGRNNNNNSPSSDHHNNHTLMEDEEFDAALDAMNPIAASYLLDHLLDSLLGKSSYHKGHGSDGNNNTAAASLSVSQRRQLLLLRAYRRKVMQQRGSGGNSTNGGTTTATTAEDGGAVDSTTAVVPNNTTVATSANGGASGGDLVSYASFPYYAGGYKPRHSYHEPTQSKHAALIPYEPPTLCCPTCRRPFDTSNGEFTPNYFRNLPLIPAKENNGDIAEFVAEKEEEEKGKATAVVAEVEEDTNEHYKGTSLPSKPGEEEVQDFTKEVASGYYQQHFEEIRKIGSGTFGGVFACRHMVCGESLGIFAVKKVPIGMDMDYLRTTLREVRLLEEVRRHPNVVEYHHAWIDYARTTDFGPVIRCLFILQEYASEGSLDDYFIRQSEGISDAVDDSPDARRERRREQLRQRLAKMMEATSSNPTPKNNAQQAPAAPAGIPALHRLSNAAVWYFFLSAVAGTRHLHHKGVIHRDLKPQNLLLSAVDDIEDENGVRRARPPRVMVSDFGTAAVMSELPTAANSSPSKFQPTVSRTGATGTLEYMAPELFAAASTPSSPISPGGPPTARYLHHHTKASDMYALGLILHYLAFGGVLPANNCGTVMESDRSGGQHVLKGPPSTVELDTNSPHHPASATATDANTEDGRALVRPIEMIGLIKLLLSTDPSKRPTCEDILSSAYIKHLLETFERTSWEEITSYKQPPATVPLGATTAFRPSSGAVSRQVSAPSPATSPPPSASRTRRLPRTESAFLDELDASVLRGDSRAPSITNMEESFVVPYRSTEIPRSASKMILPN